MHDSRFRFPPQLSGVLRFSLCAAIIAIACAGCTPARFPVVHPVKKTDRRELAKAKAEEYFIIARNYERRGYFAQAEQKYAEAYELDPSSAILRDQLVRYHVASGRLMQALVLIKGGKTIAELGPEEKRAAAGIYWRMGEFAKAVETLESIDDRTESDWNLLAILHESGGNVARAIDCYRAYFRKSGGSLDLGIKIVRMMISQKRLSAADSLVDSLTARFGAKAALLDCGGQLRLARGDTAGALREFNAAAAVDSLFEEAQRNAAQIYLQRGDYPNAIVRYEYLYRNSLLYQEVFGRTLAILYYYGRRFGEAANLLEKLLETRLEDAELHYYLGLVLAAMKKNDLARIELEKSVALDAGSEDAWRELCYLSIRDKDYARALSVAERYCRLSPKKAAAWRLKGYALSSQKEYGRAAEALARAVALDSTDVSALFELASCHERNKDIARAARYFGKVLALRPMDPAACNYLGYMWAEKGMKLDSAKNLIETALSKEPDNGAFLDSYAWVFYQMGDLEKAYRYIAKAVARVDNDGVVLEHLGDILLGKGDLPGALSAYRRSLDYNPESADAVRRKIIETEVVLRRAIVR